jgi:DNA-directed RNA polymerase subunit K/omega
MSLLRRQLSTSTSNNIETRDLNELRGKTGNVYESIAVIAKRANQINISLKEELHNKLEEFASHTDSLEEIHENKEQIEISRAYEKMPNPSLLAAQEFIQDKVPLNRPSVNQCDLFSKRVAFVFINSILEATCLAERKYCLEFRVASRHTRLLYW